MYISHYSCATADTWASELGILSKDRPRLVTSFFLQSVPHGTNGGMSWIGTFASLLGGTFIGLIFYLFSFALPESKFEVAPQYPMIFVGSLCGLIGSLFDSLLGATLQASYYSKDRQCIVKAHDMNETLQKNDKSIILICGINILTNEQVNFVSIFMTMICSISIGQFVYSLV